MIQPARQLRPVLGMARSQTRKHETIYDMQMRAWMVGAAAIAAACDGDRGAANGGADAAQQQADGGTCAVTEPAREGEATYYAGADGSGNCSFPATPKDLMVGAMNRTDYKGSAACGACATVAGPLGEVTVRIVDQCPECQPGDIDLSPEAFDRIAMRASGRVPIRWHYVPCEVSGPVRYHFKDGSSQWWTAVQVRNHQHPVAKLEVEKRGAFVAIARETYNYFVDPSGMGPGPYTFRLTDVHGNQIVDRAIPLRDDQEVAGTQQFPRCGSGE